MNIAIVGSSGYIAGFLIRRLSENAKVKKLLCIDQNYEADEYLNLVHPDEFDYEVLKNIDYVVFTAAISSPDRCAADFELCWSINVDGTKYFIGRALNMGCRVLFFSSDAVYGNISGKIYTEDSVTRAETAYGRMKKSVEDEFENHNMFKVIRLSYVVSCKDKFVSYCLECMKKEKTAEIFHPFYRNCIVISDVIEAVMWLLERWDEFNPHKLNIAGGELVSRVRIADELNRYFGDRLKYTILSPGSCFYDNRPPITQMTSLYLTDYKIVETGSFTEKFQKEMDLRRNNN